MRNVLSPYDISALLECSQSSPHTCLNVRHGVVPSGLTRYFQSRTACAHTLFGKVFHSLPNLLYLADAQFCLVQQYEMLVKVVVTVKHIAACVEAGVTTGTPGFLHIVLQRV